MVRNRSSFAIVTRNPSCSDIFGCVGLRSTNYCILNKQYSKEEYKTMIPKVIAHMNEMPYTDSKGKTYTYGEFFPAELSPFAYNESLAQEYYPLDKATAEEQGIAGSSPTAS